MIGIVYDFGKHYEIIDLHFQTMLSFPSNNDNDTFLDSDSFSEAFFNESDLDVDRNIIGK